jgi:PAS domain S-box-containing protein
MPGITLWSYSRPRWPHVLLRTVEPVGILAIVVALQAVVICALMIGRARRAPEEREQLIREASLVRLWDRAPVMLWTARPDATLDYVNQTCADFTGRPLEQLVNEGWLDAVHPDDVVPSRDVYMPAIEARRPFQMEYRIKGADGQYHWMLAQGVPRYDSQKAYAGYVGCDLDITVRKAAEQSMRESQGALEASHRRIQELAGRLIEAQDAERARIARDLHDDVSQACRSPSVG